MKNKYTPVSDSDESFKTLIDEKADIHSSDGTPPPYSASNKFIDLEMADGSAQNSAQESVDNTRSDPSANKESILVTYPEWYRQAGFNMCVSALYVCFLNVPGFAMYYTAKKIIQFEKINNLFLYVVCFVDFVLFLFISMNPIARERLRLLVIDIGNGANAIGNGIL
ncbi:uncharacterized protein SOCG_04636 [Schizosaccharomyces octosporus yFS286]|uniref:Uncharacterized protein n=1 Tax=Schizosaccharomyces octosporus (strain yFS286) TaxID=483514 RepID=S9RN41_SCHOY|nr:uncharacterized protein SOCG_04636 [Schizosaccharomyces octosporus yFS286]EPX75394.1 hypothetical protein SOCG_04636 [Schizosaccharomyces octosporus yFS286]